MDIYCLIGCIITLLAGFKVKPQLRRLISGDSLCMEILRKSKAFCRRQIIRENNPCVIADRLIRIRIEDHLQDCFFKRFRKHISELESRGLSLCRKISLSLFIFLASVH